MLKFVARTLRWSNYCAMLLFSGSMLAGYATPLAAEVARGADCLDCHEQAVVGFNASFHAKAWQDKNDCQSCHGATDQHVNDPSKQTVISFSKDGGRLADELSNQCLGCHAASANLALWDMGAHKKNDVTCAACHDSHTTRSTVNEPQVCFGCHQDIRSDANKMSHHPIIEGKVKCSDCHNTHGTLTKNMIKADSLNQLCYTCHAEKRGPWIWEHPPVTENCAICHTPHGSRHETLLVERTVSLCQNCHDDRRHHTTIQDNNTDSHYVRARACLECHKTIHGSANLTRSFSR